MLLDIDSMLNDMVQNQLKVSHLEEKVTSKVIPMKKINTKLKNLITKEYDAKLLKDADYVVAFYENATTPTPEENTEQDDGEEEVIGTEDGEETNTDAEKQSEETSDDTEETTEEPKEDTEETNDTEEPEETSDDEDVEFGVGGDTEEEPSEEQSEETSDDTEEDTEETTEEPKEDTEDDEDKKEQANESMKIQDLTKSMLSTITPKTSKPKSSSPKKESKSSTKKCECKTDKKDESKCCCKKEKLEEAETKATGANLRAKVEKAINTVFKHAISEENKLEMYDLRGTTENFYFTIVTMKKRDSQTTDNK